MELLEQFKQNWSRIVGPDMNGRVLLAVSGGSDSMVMADLFIRAQIPMAIAHCNFSLRGTASDEDENLVTSFAAKAKIPFHTVRFNTKQKMAEWKKGVQETARILRYQWLEQVRQQHGYILIATAHHANDNAETLLMHLFKGTGIAGLHGIPKQNGKLIRPLLFSGKSAIENYATVHGVPYRDDASNATDAYQRNVVRHHIIPAIEKWFPDAVMQIHETAGRLSEVEILYRRAVAAEVKKLTEYRGQDCYIPVRKLQKTTPLSAIFYELFTGYGFTPAQIPAVMQLMEAETGRYIASPTHRVIRNRDFLVITDVADAGADMIVIPEAPGAIHTADGVFSFSIKEMPPAVLPSGSEVVCLDMRAVRFPLILRRWRTGDYFYPLGMGMKKKKLSRFFIDQKLPLHEKERVWILESDKRIAWVAGMRMDERFKVSVATGQVLMVHYQ